MSENVDVPLPLVDALELFRDMNEFVISFDRISSRITWGADPQILMDYIVDRNVFPRLAKIRGRLGDLVESVIGEERLEEIGESGYVYPGES
ncbi:hypothetical protein ACQPW1_19190 [Nocardia sp. CA-128927]|uniref:hypothetical protein n=1 Tax=Nocardia sp. CA-128927 TaxID=3239975 RepID=UPI003D99305E